MTTDNENLPDKEPQDKPKDPYLIRALRHLEVPADQEWTKDNRFILAGRWQMKNYPNIMIAPTELAQVIKIFEETIPDTLLWKRVFDKAESNLKTYRALGKNIRAVNVMNWLTGWCLNETLETAIKTTRLKTSGGGRR